MKSDPHRNRSDSSVMRALRLPKPLDVRVTARMKSTGKPRTAILCAAIERGLKGLK